MRNSNLAIGMAVLIVGSAIAAPPATGQAVAEVPQSHPSQPSKASTVSKSGARGNHRPKVWCLRINSGGASFRRLVRPRGSCYTVRIKSKFGREQNKSYGIFSVKWEKWGARRARGRGDVAWSGGDAMFKRKKTMVFYAPKRKKGHVVFTKLKVKHAGKWYRF